MNTYEFNAVVCSKALVYGTLDHSMPCSLDLPDGQTTFVDCSRPALESHGDKDDYRAIEG